MALCKETLGLLLVATLLVAGSSAAPLQIAEGEYAHQVSAAEVQIVNHVSSKPTTQDVPVSAAVVESAKLTNFPQTTNPETQPQPSSASLSPSPPSSPLPEPPTPAARNPNNPEATSISPISLGESMPSLGSLFELIQTRSDATTVVGGSDQSSRTKSPAPAAKAIEPINSPQSNPPALPSASVSGNSGNNSPHRPTPDAFERWSIVDNLDTNESNRTEVIAPQKKFGYILHNNQYRRFRVEEKAPDGYIQGLFGVFNDNGNVRGVRYTADPSISPKFLFDALTKFLKM